MPTGSGGSRRDGLEEPRGLVVPRSPEAAPAMAPRRHPGAVRGAHGSLSASPGPLSGCSTPMNTLGSPKPLGTQNPWDPHPWDLLPHSHTAPVLQGVDLPALPSLAFHRHHLCLREVTGSSAVLKKIKYIHIDVKIQITACPG